ncbi:hypothetical protein CEXT_663611 [Caerostris extrusa]|uniref:Uncharacterized protein n=1 Tax=Caerostris extrusa TaxID=172846 RepID=A0AAV4X0B6_CAEEX|nr:hypothetical protein CEXT_663611 [Caerostris extrusa]
MCQDVEKRKNQYCPTDPKKSSLLPTPQSSTKLQTVLQFPLVISSASQQQMNKISPIQDLLSQQMFTSKLSMNIHPATHTRN